jgi:GNAT superfamily N-acetyltransferase
VVARVTAADLEELLPLVRAYCDFYRVSPSDDALLELSRALVADPEREGVQLVARAESGEAVGFATIFWSWNTLVGDRIGVMNDLFVAPDARGTGTADELISACLEECRSRGASELIWQTAKDNARAQRVYDRIGATRSEWVDYSLPASPGDS